MGVFTERETTIEYLSYYILTFLIIFGMVLLAFIFALTNVFAASNEDIDKKESEIIVLDEKIESKKTEITAIEKSIKESKDNERKLNAKSKVSWAAITEADAAESQTKQYESDLRDARAEYISLLKEKSDAIKAIKSIKNEIDDQQKQLRKETNTKLSKLSKIIGISISKQCITMIKNNIETNCPTYKELRQLDTSNRDISGSFIVTDGFYHRNNTLYIDSWRWYDHDKQLRLIVDPPLGMNDKIKTITIESNFDTFLRSDSKIIKQNYQVVNETRKDDAFGRNGTYSKLIKSVITEKPILSANVTVYHDRYIDLKCKNAIINADKWFVLLPDTIDYMRNNCEKSHTKFDNKEIITRNYTAQDISTSQKYKDEQRLKWIKENCIFKINSCQ